MPGHTVNAGAESRLPHQTFNGVEFGREICGTLEVAELREWLTTNGTGSYASGTVAGMVTRCYHGLLVAATHPPVGRTVMLVKADATLGYRGETYDLFTNRWAGGAVSPAGYKLIEKFWLEGTVPVWRFACGEALVEPAHLDGAGREHHLPSLYPDRGQRAGGADDQGDRRSPGWV